MPHNDPIQEHWLDAAGRVHTYHIQEQPDGTWMAHTASLTVQAASPSYARHLLCDAITQQERALAASTAHIASKERDQAREDARLDALPSWRYWKEAFDTA